MPVLDIEPADVVFSFFCLFFPSTMLGNCLRMGKCNLRGEFDQRAGDDTDLRLPVHGQFAGQQPANGGLGGEVGAADGDMVAP